MVCGVAWRGVWRVVACGVVWRVACGVAWGGVWCGVVCAVAWLTQPTEGSKRCSDPTFARVRVRGEGR